ncbi:MAG: glutaminyl-peptide cyclotransferase [Bacteroidales bacterium]|nr:glutaminyl-peptide cyclotransferase [Bacteroidales bacterium]
MSIRINNILRLVLCIFIAGVSVGCHAGPKQYGVKVVATYPHSRESYTQGLYFSKDGTLYETTGGYGTSNFMKVDILSGKALQSVSFNKKFFGEGSVALNGKVYILTWENHLVFVYDEATMTYEKTYSWPYEGWGITTDGTNLILSTGSATLYYVNPDTFKILKRVNVTSSDRPMRLLNELEWIDGKIWSNVYLSNLILIINPDNGKVEGIVDCTGLLPDSLRKADTDVLNGIARNPLTGKIYLTGKLWPQLYEVELIEK